MKKKGINKKGEQTKGTFDSNSDACFSAAESKTVIWVLQSFN
jgi:hypothetical protein